MYFNGNFDENESESVWDCYESVSLGYLCLAFWVVRLFLGSFMGFWGWIYECEGDARSFMGFWGIFRGFFKGLECSLCL